MSTGVPNSALPLMTHVYRKIFPEVNRELHYWTKMAEQIPNRELRTQALASINAKRFHCQGGAVYALLAGKRWRDAVRFIVAFQTISDYLDNLCDRSTSLDPSDFRLLHQSMVDALSPENGVGNYYALREDQDDDGYLVELVKTAQHTLRYLHGLSYIQDHIVSLNALYNDLQVHKHVNAAERVPRLRGWFDNHNKKSSKLEWYEFSAASGSTLGIFCLLSYTLGGRMSEELAQQICGCYFPYMQGLHILLDYFIDQQEDIDEGDLNFCSYYTDYNHMEKRLVYFINNANKFVQYLPDQEFHKMVVSGLVGLYLADEKVQNLKGGNKIIRSLLQASGRNGRFFYRNIRVYHKISN
ncbi:tetraprenyl-beta-curcumene synthase family protein [Virgibacillus oceani]|uniref:Tetraprenyl-beta-curcumene synthase n=1 Tax=Virgibacillus oceani TaxID=1479511 RepID=A0A917H334_9BACI|nr:tetraprenyl-beta-curcumene synthase family protein [Virgibacillus oceani]GGG66018.1 tetraprenyl-beta-curcumene synthase [Virgibacillus oceani]